MLLNEQCNRRSRCCIPCALSKLSNSVKALRVSVFTGKHHYTTGTIRTRGNTVLPCDRTKLSQVDHCLMRMPQQLDDTRTAPAALPVIPAALTTQNQPAPATLQQSNTGTTPTSTATTIQRISVRPYRAFKCTKEFHRRYSTAALTAYQSACKNELPHSSCAQSRVPAGGASPPFAS